MVPTPPAPPAPDAASAEAVGADKAGTGILLDLKDPNLARQNPADYIEGFYQSVGKAVKAAKKRPWAWLSAR